MSSFLDGLFAPDNTQLPATYGNEALMRRQAQLRDREAELKEKAKAARETPAPQGTMVSGIYVKPSVAQQLTPIAQQISQEIQKRGLEADQTGYDSVEASAVQAHMARRPAEDAPLQAKLAWAQQGARIPALRSPMTDYAKDLLVNEPDRVINRADKKDAQAAALAARKEALQATLEDRQQAREDQAARQREHDETLRAMKAMNGGGGSGGDKASNYQLVQDDEGNVTRVNKLTGESAPVGVKAGKSSGAVLKNQFDAQEKKANASKALSQLDEAEKLLPVATASTGGKLRDTLLGAAGMATDGSKAATQLDVLANNIASGIPRMAGQVSDADLKFIQKQAGDLANRDLPSGARLAALKQVRRIMQQATGDTPAPSNSASGKVSDSAARRQAIEDAVAKQGAPAAKPRMKFNPATGQLE